MTVVPLVEARDESRYGGKAGALAKALGDGLPVPDGFAISWESVRDIASGDAAAIGELPQLTGHCAVRSSAVGEDSSDASFAGQHATVLNVMTQDHLLDAIRDIHASATSSAALEYRRKLRVAGEPKIAVVIQRMVASEVAGVLFTRNPVTGAGERVVESAWGLGEAVVAGLVVPDRFRVAPGGAVLERIAGFKDIAIVAAENGLTRQVEIDAQRAATLSLSDQQLEQLDDLATACERVFGEERDLEFGFENGKLYLLQSRPITRAARAAEHETLPLRRFIGLGLAALLSPLNSTIIAVALPDISTSLPADAADVTRWLVTAYLVVSIVAQSPGGKLADILGGSRVLTGGRALFAIGALVSAFAPTLAVLATGRIAMAVGGALTIPTVLAELRNSVAPERRGQLFGVFGAIMGSAAAVGPLIGGLLTERFGWHSIFLVNLPVVALSLILEPPHRDKRAPRARQRFDVGGAVLFTIAAVCLVAALQIREPIRLVYLLVAAITGVLFVRTEHRAADPMLDIELFSHRPFAAGGSIVGLQNLAMYAILFLIPFLLARSDHAASAGSAMLAMTASMVLASPIGGRLGDHYGPRLIVAAGSLIAFTGALLLFTSNAALSPATFIALIVLGAGLGISTSPSQAAALSSISRENAGMASGALSTMRYLGGVLGSSVVAVLVSDAATEMSAGFLIFPAVLLASAGIALLLPGQDAVRER